MQHKKNQMSMGVMIQRCHRWRQKRKTYLDQARTTSDEIERERLLQMAEHYGRIVNDEQGKIDSGRGDTDKPAKSPAPGIAETPDDNSEEEDDLGFPDFMTAIK